MKSLTPAEAAELDHIAKTAIYDLDAGIEAITQAGQIATKLRDAGIRATAGVAMTAEFTQAWITIQPTTLARLEAALVRADLVEDETRRRAHAHGWHDIYLHGVTAPLFVLIDPTAEAVPE